MPTAHKVAEVEELRDKVSRATIAISTTYTVLILSTGTTTASTLIQDFSGSSYHYNNDYGVGINSITITALPPPTPNITLTKSVNPSGTALPGALHEWKAVRRRNRIERLASAGTSSG